MKDDSNPKCECHQTEQAKCTSIFEHTYYCTRILGHKGKHIACGITHNSKEWDNEKTN